jgi:hypothetical protein
MIYRVVSNGDKDYLTEVIERLKAELGHALLRGLLIGQPE